MLTDDTIVAIATPAMPAARIVLRTSGPIAMDAAASLGVTARARGRHEVKLRFDGLVLPAVAYLLPGPRGPTGQDVVEYHLPGNPILARQLLDVLIGRGLRQAEPGEFTARGLLAGRLSLNHAEAVAAVIAAGSDAELRAARQLRSGELSRRLEPAMDLVAHTLAMLEVGLDFSEEDVTFLPAEQMHEQVQQAMLKLAELIEQSVTLESLQHMPVIVLAGRPNAGKSTLLNALSGQSRAVTSAIAGTTRDVLSAQAALLRGTVRLLDAAGLEEAAGDDAIAQQMHANARRAASEADVLALVIAADDLRPPIALPRPEDVVIRSKADQTPGAQGVSALTGVGMAALRDQLDALAFGTERTGFALTARHIREITDARAEMMNIDLQTPPEMAAYHLRQSLDHLGQVLGVVTSDDILGQIFSSFCIGK